MRNLKVSSKLLVSFTIILSLTVVVGVVGLVGMAQINAANNKSYDEGVLPISYLKYSSGHFQSIRIDLRNLALAANDPSRAGALKADIYEQEQAFHRYMSQINALVSDTELRRLYEAAMSEFKAYMEIVYDVHAAILSGGSPEELGVLVDSGTLHSDSFAESVTRMTDLYMEAAEDANVYGDQLFRLLLIVVFAVIGAAIAVGVFLTRYISGLISKPLAPLTSFLNRFAATGDLQFDKTELEEIDKFRDNQDELGQLTNATVEFAAELVAEMEKLEKIADGDLTIVPNKLSEKDIVGGSLTKVVNNLNSVLGEIHIASAQVSSGSQQIADGAQALAQGSTEQAATVQELSASTSEIAEQTISNADMASQAASLAGIIKGKAEEGSRQMDDMVLAVNEISQASQSISKVIKVIDDIAFQTNILALNAAVEAARAGQHGKGFAVVADEVRTLAAKSAEAAKDTGVLISNSMEKAEHGVHIAQGTAASLGEIVSGINESTEVISKIAQSSELQRGGVKQINIGIDQIATVVQQNSATAEESAAAAEELSSQSAMLENLIKQFKLRDSDDARRAKSPSMPSEDIQRQSSHTSGFALQAESEKY